MKINLIVIRTTKPKELSEFYELLGIKFDFHRHETGTTRIPNLRYCS